MSQPRLWVIFGLGTLLLNLLAPLLAQGFQSINHEKTQARRHDFEREKMETAQVGGRPSKAKNVNFSNIFHHEEFIHIHKKAPRARAFIVVLCLRPGPKWA
jgi:hypothetical protein